MESDFSRSNNPINPLGGDSISPPINKDMALNRYNLGLFNSGTYYPFICDLEHVTQAEIALVTTTEPHGFELGNTVQFFIPQQWGMRQLNGLKGVVIAIPSDDEIEVDINTSTFDAFTIPSPPAFVVIDPAQVAGIGDVNYGNLSPGGVPVQPMTVPGAFLNQPPG